MSTELMIVGPDSISQSDAREIDSGIAEYIERCQGNRQDINRLVFESVSALTSAEEYEQELADKKGLRRFFGDITGSNKALQDKINSSRGAAQYAAQQTLQRLAEQNLLTFDLIAAVHNKLSAGMLAMDQELNQLYSQNHEIVQELVATQDELEAHKTEVRDELQKIYGALSTFFRSNRSDMVKLATRVDRLEQNVNLLNWQNSIEYQMFGDTGYPDLDDNAKIICIVRDFFNITRGDWSTSDLLLLKTAMGTIGLAPNGETDYYTIIKSLAYNPSLSAYFFEDAQLQQQPDSYLVPLLGAWKLNALQNDEKFVVDTMVETLSSQGVTKEPADLREALACNYLLQTAGEDVNISVNNYDLVMEMLFNLQAAYLSGLFDSASQPSQALHTAPAGVLPSSQRRVAGSDKLAIAEDLFCRGQVSDAIPLLTELSNSGEMRANAMLGFLSILSFPGRPADTDQADAYFRAGREAEDPLCSLIYRCYDFSDNSIQACHTWAPIVAEMTHSGDRIAAFLLGLYYRIRSFGDYEDGIDYDDVPAFEYLLRAAQGGVIWAFFGMAMLLPDDNEGTLVLARQAALGGDADSWEKLGNVCRAHALVDEAEKAYIACNAAGGDCSMELGDMLRENDREEDAVPYYEAAGESGDSDAYLRLGDMFEFEDTKRAIDYFKDAGRSGNLQGYVEIGDIYNYGHGDVSVNEPKAVKFYRKAADRGSAEGMSKLADMYWYGWGVGRDESEAAKWYERAIDSGYENEMDILAHIYRYGDNPDLERAAMFYEQLADNGNGPACTELGDMYWYGNGVEEDEEMAGKYYLMAVENGDESRCARLGFMYRNGRGVEEDDEQAAHFYKIAADNGDAASLNGYGFMVQHGLGGLIEDEEEAVQYYWQSAAKDDPSGQYNLGWCLYHGVGIGEDEDLAEYWLCKAAGNGHTGAEEMLMSKFDYDQHDIARL